MVRVSWNDAQVFSSWTGPCFPTEAECRLATSGLLSVASSPGSTGGHGVPPIQLEAHPAQLVGSPPSGSSPLNPLGVADHVWGGVHPRAGPACLERRPGGKTCVGRFRSECRDLGLAAQSQRDPLQLPLPEVAHFRRSQQRPGMFHGEECAMNAGIMLMPAPPSSRGLDEAVTLGS